MNQTFVAIALFSAGWLGLLPFRLLEAILPHGGIIVTLLLIGISVAAGGIALMLRTRLHR